MFLQLKFSIPGNIGFPHSVIVKLRLKLKFLNVSDVEKKLLIPLNIHSFSAVCFPCYYEYFDETNATFAVFLFDLDGFAPEVR